MSPSEHASTAPTGATGACPRAQATSTVAEEDAASVTATGSPYRFGSAYRDTTHSFDDMFGDKEAHAAVQSTASAVAGSRHPPLR